MWTNFLTERSGYWLGAGRGYRRPAMNRRDTLVLRAAAIWTIWVWGTRIWNIWRDDHAVGFKAVHTVLAVVSVAFAVAIWRIASRAAEARRGSGRRPRPDESPEATGTGATR